LESHEDYNAKADALTWYVEEYLPWSALNHTKDFRQVSLMTSLRGMEILGPSHHCCGDSIESPGSADV
jgi:hypothetical protein